MAAPRKPVTLAHITTLGVSLNFVAGSSRYVKAKGFEVCAIATRDEWLDIFGERENIPVYPIEMSRRITPLQDLRALAAVCLRLRKVRPHIVHAHTPKAGLLGMSAAWLMRSPVRIYDIWGLPHDTAHGLKRWLLINSERLACRLAHRVFCVGFGMRDQVVAEGICPTDKITVFEHGSVDGVDSDGLFNPDRIAPETPAAIRQSNGIPLSAPVIGFIGRMVRDKGIRELMTAWTELREEFPDLHLLMLGRHEETLPEDIARQLEQDPRIHVAGTVYPECVPDYLAAIDIVALPTYREGFPNVPLEAAAMQVPIVATRIPGCVDAVEDNSTGMLVPARDVKALHDALARYLQDATLRQQHGAAARARVVQHFQSEPIRAAMHREYLRLFEQRVGTQAQDE